MSGILSYNLVTQNSGYADIPKVLVIIGFFVIVYLICLAIAKIYNRISEWKTKFYK